MYKRVDSTLGTIDHTRKGMSSQSMPFDGFRRPKPAHPLDTRQEAIRFYVHLCATPRIMNRQVQAQEQKTSSSLRMQTLKEYICIMIP